MFLAEIDDEYVIATICNVSKKKRIKCGNGSFMVVQEIDILPEGTNETITVDAAEISHVFWDRGTDCRYSNLCFNIKHETLCENQRCEPEHEIEKSNQCSTEAPNRISSPVPSSIDKTLLEGLTGE